jgi:hypothetical protein
VPPVPSTLADIVEAVLDIPLLATTEGRDAVLALLPPELASSVPRLSTARLDTISIVTSCARYGALVDLAEAIRCCDRGSIAVAHLNAVLAEHVAAPTDRADRR